MRDVLHSAQWTDAENLRVALLAQGIKGSVHDAGIRSHPARYSVVVADGDHDAAVAIRVDLERGATNAPTQTVPRSIVLAVVLAAAAFFWWLWHASGR